MSLTHEQKQLAQHWYKNWQYSLETIAQHFQLTIEELKAELNN